MTAINGDSNNSTLITKLNEIRTTLPSAMVTTYTYKPLVGITSQTDPNGITTWYEYDGFGRLKNVLDNNSKVTGSYRYNYGSEPYLTISLHSKSFSYTGGTEYVVVKSNLRGQFESDMAYSEPYQRNL